MTFEMADPKATALDVMEGYDALPPRLRRLLQIAPINFKDVAALYAEKGEAETIRVIESLCRRNRPAFQLGAAERPIDPRKRRRRR